jgi:hypothetical protein
MEYTYHSRPSRLGPAVLESHLLGLHQEVPRAVGVIPEKRQPQAPSSQ